MVNKAQIIFGCMIMGIALLPAMSHAAGIIPDPNHAPGVAYISYQAQPCAPTVTDPSKPSISQPADAACTVNRITNRFLSDLFYLMGAVAVIMLVYSGLLYIQANGNAEATKKARQNIFNVIIGIVILSASYIIIELISGAVKYFTP